jgi:hypothetical protein
MAASFKNSGSTSGAVNCGSDSSFEGVAPIEMLAPNIRSPPSPLWFLFDYGASCACGQVACHVRHVFATRHTVVAFWAAVGQRSVSAGRLASTRSLVADPLRPTPGATWSGIAISLPTGLPEMLRKSGCPANLLEVREARKARPSRWEAA